ncbi:33434_t:CDS:2 [Gigaspora margarita]|uniref:33434_t:CDS:1 n=1 Tax=Gigaspora margarita TaxID=4874 RepID=A0ABN7URV9_GIGMA|nr:33434_t:CDS:2 [Gigaspora margarita]
MTLERLEFTSITLHISPINETTKELSVSFINLDVHSLNFSLVEQTNFSNTTLNNSVTPLFASEDILTSDDLIISSSSQNIKKKNKQPLTKDDTNSDNKLWMIWLLNCGKTSAQVHEKMQGLVKKYTEEKKEETGKGISKWLTFI